MTICFDYTCKGRGKSRCEGKGTGKDSSKGKDSGIYYNKGKDSGNDYSKGKGSGKDHIQPNWMPAMVEQTHEQLDVEQHPSFADDQNILKPYPAKLTKCYITQVSKYCLRIDTRHT